jgi:hypothetical protein
MVKAHPPPHKRLTRVLTQYWQGFQSVRVSFKPLCPAEILAHALNCVRGK